MSHSLIKKNNIFQKFSFILLLSLIISLFFSITVSAYEPTETPNDPTKSQKCQLCGEVHDWKKIKKSPFKRMAYQVVYVANSSILGGPMENQISNKETGDYYEVDTFTVKDLLKFDVDGEFKDIFTVAEGIYNNIAILGSIMVFIYFLLEISQVSLEGGFTYESWLRLGIRTIIAFLIIRNGMEFIRAGLRTCTEIYNKLPGNSLAKRVYSLSPEFCPGTELSLTSDLDIISPFGWIISHCFEYWIITILSFYLRIKCWARVIDIVVRVMFAPIGLSDTVKSGGVLHSHGLHYFKKLLASVLQASVLVATIFAFEMIVRTDFGIYGKIIISLALLTAIKQGGDLANEIVGV